MRQWILNALGLAGIALAGMLCWLAWEAILVQRELRTLPSRAEAVLRDQGKALHALADERTVDTLILADKHARALESLLERQSTATRRETLAILEAQLDAARSEAMLEASQLRRDTSDALARTAGAAEQVAAIREDVRPTVEAVNRIAAAEAPRVPRILSAAEATLESVGYMAIAIEESTPELTAQAVRTGGNVEEISGNVARWTKPRPLWRTILELATGAALWTK
jgi:hypothetical protein